MEALGSRLDRQAEMLNLALRQLNIDYKPTDTAQELRDSSTFGSLAEEGLGWRFDQQAEMLRLVLQRLGVSDKSVDATQASSSLAAFVGRHRGGLLQWRASAASQRLSAVSRESSPAQRPSIISTDSPRTSLADSTMDNASSGFGARWAAEDLVRRDRNEARPTSEDQAELVEPAIVFLEGDPSLHSV